MLVSLNDIANPYQVYVTLIIQNHICYFVITSICTHREVVLTVVQSDGAGQELSRQTKKYTFPDGEALPPSGTTAVAFAAAVGAKKVRATLVQVMTKTEGRPQDIRQPIQEAETQR